MKVKVTNIKWEIDLEPNETYEQALQEIGLPTEVIMDYPMDDYPSDTIDIPDDEIDDDVICDKLSEDYEWLLQSFNFEKVKE